MMRDKPTALQTHRLTKWLWRGYRHNRTGTMRYVPIWKRGPGEPWRRAYE